MPKHFKGKFFVPGVRNSRCPPPEKPTNKPVSLGDKNDDEIILSTKYEFSVDIETLLNNSKTTRRSHANPDKPPRPQNAFMLYRRDKSAKHMKENKGKKFKQSNFSVEISVMWKNESLEVKELFRALARVSEKIHLETHGEGYKYLPRNKRPNYRKKNNEDGSSHSCSDTDIGSPSSTNIPDSPASDNNDTSNIFYNTDDTIASSVNDFSDFSGFSALSNNNLNNNSSSYANFNAIPPVTPVTSVSPVTPELPVDYHQFFSLMFDDQEFRWCLSLACKLYMDTKSKNSTPSQTDEVTNTPPEFNEYFDYSSFQ